MLTDLAHNSLADTPDTLPLQRVLTIIVLLLLVLFFAPYQFAYLVIVLVHLFSTIRCLVLAQEAAPASPNSAGPSSAVTAAAARRLWDRYHYAFSVLFVLVTLLPINALILVVWVRNLAVGWLAPFSSDHNVLMVVGFLANVEALHSGKMLQRSAAGRCVPRCWFRRRTSLTYSAHPAIRPQSRSSPSSSLRHTPYSTASAPHTGSTRSPTCASSGSPWARATPLSAQPA